MFSPWYRWQIADLTLNNNHSITRSLSYRMTRHHAFHYQHQWKYSCPCPICDHCFTVHLLLSKWYNRNFEINTNICLTYRVFIYVACHLLYIHKISTQWLHKCHVLLKFLWKTLTINICIRLYLVPNFSPFGHNTFFFQFKARFRKFYDCKGGNQRTWNNYR